jgi:hypothetical protein
MLAGGFFNEGQLESATFGGRGDEKRTLDGLRGTDGRSLFIS